MIHTTVRIHLYEASIIATMRGCLLNFQIISKVEIATTSINFSPNQNACMVCER
jgi:hypothetical protein